MSAGPRPATVAVRTLGCKVNRVESDAISAELLGQGCRVTNGDVADVIVINTCTVTGEADAKARKAVRQALGSPGSPVVVVTGCLAAVDRAALESLGERLVVVADKSLVGRRVAELLGTEWRTPASRVARTGDGFRTRVMVKVQDGCDNHCAYCIVPHARGGPRSIPADEVVAEVESLVAAGVCEVVLTGINIGRYFDEGAGIAGLVRRVAETGARRVRLSSIEPPDVTQELLEVMAARADVVCPHLHVPLQSGSDRVLREMGRRYTTAEFEQRVEAARAAVPGLAVTTDVIAGLPGECDEDALETLELCERIGFSRMHVFRYSPRPGTPAASRPDQVPAQLRGMRAQALRELDARLRARHFAARCGEAADVLVERVEDGFAEGTTRDYLRVRFSAAVDVAAGDIISVIISDDIVR